MGDDQGFWWYKEKPIYWDQKLEKKKIPALFFCSYLCNTGTWNKKELAHFASFAP